MVRQIEAPTAANVWKEGDDKEETHLLTVHGSDALKALEIPQLDGHICRARC